MQVSYPSLIEMVSAIHTLQMNRFKIGSKSSKKLCLGSQFSLWNKSASCTHQVLPYIFSVVESVRSLSVFSLWLFSFVTWKTCFVFLKEVLKKKKNLWICNCWNIVIHKWYFLFICLWIITVFVCMCFCLCPLV